MRLLVSIHDVSPAWDAEVRALWLLCEAHGIRPALLVVPEWHGAWPLESHPSFVAWLRACAESGADIILHGERHDEVGSPRSVRGTLRALGRTAREGEFLMLDGAAALERITRGLARLRALGLAPVGFVPPAWLATEAGHQAVGAAGLAFSEDDQVVRLVPGPRRLAAPAVRWSARTAVRAAGSVLVAAARRRLQRSAPLVRLALHPGDVRHPWTRASVTAALASWPRSHRPVPYRELLAA